MADEPGEGRYSTIDEPVYVPPEGVEVPYKAPRQLPEPETEPAPSPTGRLSLIPWRALPVMSQWLWKLLGR